MSKSDEKSVDFGCSIFVVDRRTEEQQEQDRQRYREARISLGACPECLKLKSDWSENVKSNEHAGESDAERNIRHIIDGLWCGRKVGNCKTCGAPLFQDVM